MALQLNDEQLASFEALTGIDPGQLNDVTVAYLKSVSGSDSNDPQDLWYATLTGLGYSGAVQDMQLEYWADITGTTGQWNDLYYQWLIDTGGAFGPNVAIVDDTPIPFCEYVEPVTECTASGPYTANDSGFTNPADTWLWTLEPPVAGIVLTNATLKTCTVETQDFATKQSFNLKVVATDSVSTDTATRTTAFLQRHIDATAAPVFIGPDINNVQFEINDPISAFDFTLVFTGTNLVYDTIGTWPTGLSLSSVGILTGTPTVEETVAGLQVRATNSKGNAVTNTFDVEITNLGYSLAVTEQAAGSCSWEVPQTGCTAQGTYIATPTDYVPDTWVWSFSTITQGTPTITAGQGTNTVTVDSTGPTTAIFTLKCVASNADPKSAQDLTQFTQVHTDDTVAIAFDGPNIGDQTFIVDELFTLDVSSLFSGTIETWALLGTWPTSFVISGAGVITGTAVIGDVGSFTGLSVRASNTLPDSADSDTFNADVTDVVLPAFYALTPDTANDYLMEGVLIGTGGLTTTHTADLYAPDFNGVYQKYPANAPVWSGGRVVLTGAAGTDVVSVHANDAPAGAPLAEIPYLQYYPAAQNDLFNSRDMTGWSPTTDAPAVTYDQVGITGEPNTASLLVKTVAPADSGYFENKSGLTPTTDKITAKAWLKKDPAYGPGKTTYRLRFLGGTAKDSRINVSPVDGSFTTTGAAVDLVEIIDAGDWWIILTEQTQASNTEIRTYQNVTELSADTGQVTWGQSEWHFGKTIAEVRGLGPIFTTAAVATDRSNYSFAAANNDGAESAWYAEWARSSASEPSNQAYEIMDSVSGSYRILYQDSPNQEIKSWGGGFAGSVTNLNLVDDYTAKNADVWSVTDNQQQIGSDGAWGNIVTYNGGITTPNGIGLCGGSTINVVAVKFREIQRFDITSFQNGKDIIDDLMAEVLVAEDDSELTTETNDSLTKG